ncbi:MAG: DUF4337 domain-containing protein [Hyphomicrobium sp.]|jgi:hypothetical protein|nr:DUF4337 domain-containing protein [Hyphomicrobium sp.]
MALDELGDSKSLSSRDKYIGVYIGVLAVILAIGSMGGGNAAKDATLKNIEASNTWAFFQAKNARRQALRLQSDDLEMRLAVEPNLSEDIRQKISARIADYKAQDAKLTSDKERLEGLDELWEKGKSLEKDRDLALKRDPYFDYGEALLQIAIVLASVAIISGGNFLLVVSMALGTLGLISTIGGFTLAFPMPF